MWAMADNVLDRTIQIDSDRYRRAVRQATIAQVFPLCLGASMVLFGLLGPGELVSAVWAVCLLIVSVMAGHRLQRSLWVRCKCTVVRDEVTVVNRVRTYVVPLDDFALGADGVLTGTWSVLGADMSLWPDRPRKVIRCDAAEADAVKKILPSAPL